MELTESSDQSQLWRMEQSIKENGTLRPTKKIEEVKKTEVKSEVKPALA